MFKVKLASEKDHNFVVDSFTNSSIGRMHIKLWKNTKLSQIDRAKVFLFHQIHLEQFHSIAELDFHAAYMRVGHR